MAPCNYSNDSNISISNKEKNKLRKPVVEKIRRDRINSCIEQLKVLLEKEFNKKDPNAKLEKADILEMTVSFLKQQLQPQVTISQMAQSEGYSQCWRDTVGFLSASSKAAAPLQLLPRSPEARRATKELGSLSLVCANNCLVPVKHEVTAEMSLWRPW